MHVQDSHNGGSEMFKKGEQTKADLEVIAAYITDFAAIVDQFNSIHKKAEQKSKRDDDQADDS